MGEVRHTPGPWVFCDETGTIDAHGGVVAEVKGSDYTLAQDVHNAHLIAAAPELLAVVRLGRQKLATYTSVYDGDKELRSLLIAWDAAIAKAEASPNA